MVGRTKIFINGRFLTQRITGVQRYAHEFLRALDGLLGGRPDLEVTVLSPVLAVPAPSWRNIRHRSVGRLQGHAWEQLELPRHVGDGVLYCPGNTAPLALLFRRPRPVVCIHDLSYLYFPAAYDWRFRLAYNILMPVILRRAAAVVTVSESERRSILDHYPHAAPRLTAIQNGGLPADFNGGTAATGMTPGYILYVGSLSRRKNFPNMLEVACRLARARGVRFVFVGGIPDGFQGSGTGVPDDLRDRITFTGQIDDTATLVAYYRDAACLLFPSFYEASPLPPIEAMACGCPVIASTIQSLLERCGDAALYCDPTSVDSIAEALTRILDDTALSDDLRRRGLERAASFTWETCARNTLAVIARAG